ncbi:MAG: ABC transporter permease [Anaerolineales bacterium]|nr:ABC transporter permease [Anaerolineales bacterium]
MSSPTTDISGAASASAERHTSGISAWEKEGNRLSELFRSRYLLRNLVVRDLKVRYKNSILGVLWSLLNPLLMMSVFWIVFTVLLPNDVPNYHIFILSGLLPWNFFNHSLMGGTTSITANSHLIKKVYFPRELLPIASTISHLINFGIAFIVLVALLYVAGIGLTRFAIWVPFILLAQILFALGLTLFTSALHVHYRDVMMLLDVGILAWFFLTPVFYPFEWLTESGRTVLGFSVATIMRWVNPMASIIDGYRTVLWGTWEGSGPASMDPAYFLRTFVTALLTFILGYIFFRRTQHTFGERL